MVISEPSSGIREEPRRSKTEYYTYNFIDVYRMRVKETNGRQGGSSLFFLYAYTIKPPAKLVVPLTALALDKKTSNDIISVGPKPHYI